MTISCMSFLRIKGFFTGFTTLSSVVQANQASDPHVFSFQKSASQCEVAYLVGSTNELRTQPVIPAKQNVLRKTAVDIYLCWVYPQLCRKKKGVINGTGFKFIYHFI